MTFREKLASRSKKAGISLESDVIQGLEAYFGLLQRWNRKVSLTSLPVDSLGDEAIDRILIESPFSPRNTSRPAMRSSSMSVLVAARLQSR